MKILLIVGSAGIDPWVSIEELGQKTTFASCLTSEVETVWMQPNPSLDGSMMHSWLNEKAERRFAEFRVNYNLRDPIELWNAVSAWCFNNVVRLVLGWRRRVPPRVEGDSQRITFPYPTLYYLAPLRINNYLRHALENFEFDFLLRTTSTCYVDFDRLLATASESPPFGLYAGDIMTKRKVSFVGGAAILFSRDVVEQLVANEALMRLDVHEDVAIGELFARLGIASPTEIARVDVAGKSSAEIIEAWRGPNNPFIFRCKFANHWTDSVEPVVSLMSKVHNAIIHAKSATTEEGFI
jgi:hypothetical protein